jgi:hypothetical protein
MTATDHAVRFLVECQACGTTYRCTWPYLRTCPTCASPVQTLLSGRVTDEMVANQGALLEALKADPEEDALRRQVEVVTVGTPDPEPEAEPGPEPVVPPELQPNRRRQRTFWTEADRDQEIHGPGGLYPYEVTGACADGHHWDATCVWFTRPHATGARRHGGVIFEAAAWFREAVLTPGACPVCGGDPVSVHSQGRIDAGPPPPRLVSVIFDGVHRLDLAHARCCLTGDFAFAPREVCEEAVVARGGTLKSGVSRQVDVLIVGSLGSPDWKFGGFGTKVAKAIQLRRAGAPIAIVSEDTFAAATELA